MTRSHNKNKHNEKIRQCIPHIISQLYTNVLQKITERTSGHIKIKNFIKEFQEFK